MRSAGPIARGAYRRYVTTEVVAHWSTVKPGYRLFLEDGTPSRDEWRPPLPPPDGAGSTSPAPSAVEPLQRPHLTLNNSLLGTGPLRGRAEARRRLPAWLPLRDDPWRRPRRPLLVRPSRPHTRRRASDSASCSVTARRSSGAQGSSRNVGSRPGAFLFSPATGSHHEIWAIRTSGSCRRRGDRGARRLADGRDRPLELDEGLHRRHLRRRGSCQPRRLPESANKDQEIIDRVARAMVQFDFRFSSSKGRHPNGREERPPGRRAQGAPSGSSIQRTRRSRGSATSRAWR